MAVPILTQFCLSTRLTQVREFRCAPKHKGVSAVIRQLGWLAEYRSFVIVRGLPLRESLE
jgi:hypothetical protein